jgi:hypothetical protein
MAKGVPHALSGRRPKKPIIRPRRFDPKVAEAAQVVPTPPAPKIETPKPSIPAPEPAAPAKEEAPLHLLEGSVTSLKEALETGHYDEHLDALFDAEKAGKNRKTAMDALSERMG